MRLLLKHKFYFIKIEKTVFLHGLFVVWAFEKLVTEVQDARSGTTPSMVLVQVVKSYNNTGPYHNLQLP
jgi:hypothetical protein